MSPDTNKTQLIEYIIAKLAEAPILAKQKTREDGKEFIPRRIYSRIKKRIDEYMARQKTGIQNRIVLIPGLRGVGKTTLLLQIYQYLTQKKHIDQSRVLYFSADELKEYLGGKISELVKTYVEGNNQDIPHKPKQTIIHPHR